MFRSRKDFVGGRALFISSPLQIRSSFPAMNERSSTSVAKEQTSKLPLASFSIDVAHSTYSFVSEPFFPQPILFLLCHWNLESDFLTKKESI
jgi:hypothetical protein